jgi:hypothetical protein
VPGSAGNRWLDEETDFGHPPEVLGADRRPAPQPMMISRP